MQGSFLLQITQVYLNTFQVLMNTRKLNKNSQFDRHKQMRNGLVFKKSYLLRFPILSLRNTHIICSFHSQRIF